MQVRNHIFHYLRSHGYLTIDMLMEIALSKYESSYYRLKNPFDDDNGDFITSPQISQMFGEMLGIWLYNQIINNKSYQTAQKIQIVEIGAGTGNLMRDVLSVLKKTEIFSKLCISVVEINDNLRAVQKEKLKEYSVEWLASISEIPDNSDSPLLFIANEFIDALPVKQYILEKTRWKEVVVRSDPHLTNLYFDKIEVSDELDSQMKFDYKNACDGAIVEESPAAIKFAIDIANLINKRKGVGIFFDYGFDVEPKLRSASQFHPTLQAVYQHKFSPILENLGLADITYHVDFNRLRDVLHAHFIRTIATVNQGDFLKALGIETRMQELIKINPHLKKQLVNQVDRLISYDKMGSLFKVFAFCHNDESLFMFD